MAEARRPAPHGKPRRHRLQSPRPCSLFGKSLHPARHAAVQRPGQGREAAEGAGRERRPRRSGHPRRKGRGVELVIGQQHESAADQIRARRITTPGARQPLMDRSFSRTSGGGVDQKIKQGRRFEIERLGATAAQGRTDGRTPGQGLKHPIMGPPRRYPVVLTGKPGVATGPQEPGHILQPPGLRQIFSVLAPVPELAPGHRRDGRGEHRLPPGYGVFGHGGFAPAPHFALFKPHDIGGAIEAAARIRTIGPGLNPSPADIGVQGLRLQTETPHHLVRRQPLRHGIAPSYID